MESIIDRSSYFVMLIQPAIYVQCLKLMCGHMTETKNNMFLITFFLYILCARRMLSWLRRDIIRCNVYYCNKTLMILLNVHHIVDIDECASNPCHNAGTCTDIVNGYTCHCSAGYTGEHCKIGMSAYL